MGQSKLKELYAKQIADQMNANIVWIEDFRASIEKELDDNFYVIHISNKLPPVFQLTHDGHYEPVIRLSTVLHVFSRPVVYGYFIALLITVIRVFNCWRKVRTKRIAENELIDEAS